MDTKDPNQKSGFVSVIGLPNAGKSTLVNALVGAKVSIVSRKVQTTRSRVLGIAIDGAAQIVLMDTPGIFEPGKTLERAMVQAALRTMEEADITLHIVDASLKNCANKNSAIIQKLPKDKPRILALNKIDRIAKGELLALAEDLSQAGNYDAVFMISALKKDGIKELLQNLASRMPDALWPFEEDQITDLPMRFMAAEITREKIFNALHQELPYAALVETESWENFDDGSVKISQVIYVQRTSQRAIVLGKGGKQIKSIGQEARKDIEELLGTRAHLKLFVKVQEDWSERSEFYQKMGLELPQ